MPNIQRAIKNILIIILIGVAILVFTKPDLVNTFNNKVFDKIVQLQSFLNRKDSQTSNKNIFNRTSKNDSSIVKDDVQVAANQPLSSEYNSSSDQNSLFATQRIIADTNKERANAGLPVLESNDKLVASAEMKINDMVKNQYFEHISPKGVTVSDLGLEVGYDYIVMGENLAMGNFTNAEDVVVAWMNSPGHRANILNPNYQEMGAAAQFATYQGKKVWFVVQHFGTNRDVCPAISTSLKSTIDDLNQKLKSMQAQIMNEKATLEAPNHPNDEAYREKVNEFNKLVSEYNNNLVVSQDKISQYNEEVTAFNNCLLKYQSTKKLD